jgi:alkanesulfonate monooxygenase
VGSFKEIADAIMEYKQRGITQFLFMGWPDREEINYFGTGVLPLIRAHEKENDGGVLATREARAESA